MDEEWTCGKGLAAHSPVPLALGEMMSAMATMLDFHTRAIDTADEPGKAEYAAYASLLAQHRVIAAALQAAGNEMGGYIDLPVAKHDTKMMASPEFGTAFQSLVETEKMLLQVLATIVDEHEKMLFE